MLVEMRTYSLFPGTVGRWLALYEAKGLRVHTATLGNLLGYFTSEFGDINEIIHLWGYDSFEERDSRRRMLGESDEWKAFLEDAMPLIRNMQVRILKGTAFSPIR